MTFDLLPSPILHVQKSPRPIKERLNSICELSSCWAGLTKLRFMLTLCCLCVVPSFSLRWQADLDVDVGYYVHLLLQTSQVTLLLCSVHVEVWGLYLGLQAVLLGWGAGGVWLGLLRCQTQACPGAARTADLSTCTHLPAPAAKPQRSSGWFL